MAAMGHHRHLSKSSFWTSVIHESAHIPSKDRCLNTDESHLQASLHPAFSILISGEVGTI